MATPGAPQREWEGEPLHIADLPPPLPSREAPSEDDEDPPGSHVIVIDMS